MTNINKIPPCDPNDTAGMIFPHHNIYICSNF